MAGRLTYEHLPEAGRGLTKPHLIMPVKPSDRDTSGSLGPQDTVVSLG
jgi:hypothetical protein